MPTEQDFVSIFDSCTSQPSAMKADVFSRKSPSRDDTFLGVQQCSEEARQEQAYNLYKRDIAYSFQSDTRMENEFFGRRQLSISDFDGTRTIVTPTPSPVKLAYFADDEKSPIPSVARFPTRTFLVHTTNDDYLADDETTPTPSDFAGPPQLMNAFYFRQSLRSPSPGSMPRWNSPPYGVENFVFTHPPSTADIHQRQLESTQPSSFSSSLTPTSLIPDNLSSPLCVTNYVNYDHNLTDSEEQQILDSVESDSLLEPKESIAVNHSYTVPADLRDFLSVGLRFDNSSIRDVGFVNSSVEIQDDLTERAYVPSESGRISDISTPELTQDNDVDDLDSVNGVEFGYDASPGTLHFYSQAGVPVTTRELQDDFVAAQSTNLAGGCLDIDQAAEDEKDRANVDFFDAMGPLMTTASSQERLTNRANNSVHIRQSVIKQEYVDSDKQYLIPAIVDDLADPDYYLGPDAPAPDDSILDKVYYARHASGQILQDTITARYPPMQRLGQPKDSSLIKRRTNRGVNGEVRSLQQLLPSATFGQVSEYNAVSFTNNLSPLQPVNLESSSPVRISKTPNYGDSVIVRKRSARESFDLIELCNENARREYSSKKPRLVSTSTFKSARFPQTPASAISSIFTGSPMATALKGYTGQFELHVNERFARKEKTTTKHVFGNHLHANGEIINLQFIADLHGATTNLSDCPGLSTTIEYANLHHTFAEEMPRSGEEEALRREAHRECAAARLEGVPVGYYRYFAGHMTVEEYVEARMCVCWEGCFCSKLCTHFGDLACPCADSLVVGEDA